MTAHPRPVLTEHTLAPLPDHLDDQLRAAVLEAAEAAGRGDTAAPPVDVTNPFVMFNGHLCDHPHAAVLQAPNVRQVIFDPGGMCDDWITQQSPAALANHLAAAFWCRPGHPSTAVDVMMRTAGHAPNYGDTAEVIILGVSPDYDDLVLGRTYLYPVGHLCTPDDDDGDGGCSFPGHPHLVSRDRNSRRLPRIERIDPDLAQVARACQAGHTLGTTLAEMTPPARERLYRTIVHLVTARVAYLSATAPAPTPPPRLRWLHRLRRHPTPAAATRARDVDPAGVAGTVNDSELAR